MSGPTIGNWDENTQRLETETPEKPRSAASPSFGPRADPT